MSHIRILPPEISNRIAAGEVIERPASILKELLENSLDAGADNIKINIGNGGHKLVQVIDNGCGMNRDDALLSLEAHATSKIFNSADIDAIKTLGFRGEALPSIAAVSRFSILTRPSGNDEGTLISVHGGKIITVETAGCAQGTSISAKNIFFNMPARKKFLRTPQTERHHIQELTLLTALAYPEKSFELNIDGKQTIKVAGDGELLTRMRLLLGGETVSAMVPINYEEAGIRVYGYAARPGLSRSSRKEQRVFVNRRPVKSNTVYYGIRDGYHTQVMKGRFPPVALFIKLESSRVDVNVHPAKREVRFRESQLVGQIVAAAIRGALRNDRVIAVQPDKTSSSDENSTKNTPLQQPEPFFNNMSFVPETRASIGGLQKSPQETPFDFSRSDLFQGKKAGNKSQSLFEDDKDSIANTSLPVVADSTFKNLDIKGMLGKDFIITANSDGLVLIDINACQRRILFEQLINAGKTKNKGRQPLLIPVTTDISVSDRALLEKNIDYFEDLGFEIEHFGGNTFIINAIPTQFPQENIIGLIHRILDDLSESFSASPRTQMVQIAQAVCRQAVKISSLPKEGYRKLLDELAKTEMPYACPNGQPVMINISYSELNKRFAKK
ncbi:MAG: DNA mismatch repair endonuclease MutL [Verrucomicrobiota bacterium]|nr:DNA mismatch repair endonuclease MutL [Verrucomicrobiota bacterium]